MAATVISRAMPCSGIYIDAIAGAVANTATATMTTYMAISLRALFTTSVRPPVSSSPTIMDPMIIIAPPIPQPGAPTT